MKDKLKKIPFLKKMVYIFLSFWYNCLGYWCNNFSVFLRKSKIFNIKYRNLKQYKDIHNNERCFIVATGPSLTLEDVEKLKNEYTFSVNSIIYYFDKTSWRPTYYGIQDMRVYKILKQKLEVLNLQEIFLGNIAANKYGKLSNCNIYHNHQLTHRIINNKYWTRFSDDISVTVYDGYSVVYSMLQIAVYMGFKEIYLLGCDCNLKPGGKNHADGLEHGIDHQIITDESERFFVGYRVAKTYAEAHGVKIYNVTRGGDLEIFERKNLDDVLNS